MWQRLTLVFATLFFVVMNALLFVTEFGGRHEPGAVPVGLVWKKILTAPDSSFLEIQHHGKKIGTCRWRPSVGEIIARPRPDDSPTPEGMVEELTGYTLDLNGSVNLDEATRLGFNFDLRFSTNQTWQEVFLRTTLRPAQWEVRAAAADETIRYRYDDGEKKGVRLIPFSDLRHPDRLLRNFDVVLPPGLLGLLGLSTGDTAAEPPELGFKLEARRDWLKAGHSRLRVFRLRASLLGRLHAVAFVSPVGEILRVELPDEIVLLNRPDEYFEMQPEPP